MSLLTFVVPWVLLSLIATPFVGALLARSLGVEDDLDGEAASLDAEISSSAGVVDGGASPVTFPSPYPGTGADGADIS